MAAQDFLVQPVSRTEARTLCERHPHAGTLPNSSKFYMRLMINGQVAGLAVWGYGIVPKRTPVHMFGEAGNVRDYLELCRFFVYDWTPKNTASRFLATTHRLLKRYVPRVKWLYTYAAGFQGLIGTIYQATGYDYIGTTPCEAFIWVPDVGLVHDIAMWHRFSETGSARKMQRYFPGQAIKRWCGVNFRYLYFLCSKRERRRLMKHARFEVQPYPTEADLKIWTVDVDGKKEDVPVELAKTIPIVKLSSKRKSLKAKGVHDVTNNSRVGSSGDPGPVAERPAHQQEDGGASPTPTLHTR